MTRFTSFTALAISFATLAPAAALAQAGGYYVATAVEAPQKASFITQNTVWKCKEGICSAPRTPSTDKVMCQRAAARVGRLSAFSAGGTAFDAAALEACNARAR